MGSVSQFRVNVDEDEEVKASGAVKLNLGANQHAREGYVNVDIESFPGIDVVADLEKRWPWDDNSVDEIYTADLPEHLRAWYERPDDALLDEAERTGNIAPLIAALRKPTRTYGVIHFMEEAYRVLKPGGRLIAQIPSTDHRAWAQDPTHVSFWNENSLLYFTNDTYRAFYPHLIKSRWGVLTVGTTPPNMFGESWIKIALEKI